LRFAYRLALALGVANVEDPGGLLDTISACQFSRWRAYCLIDTFGNERGDMQAGTVANAVYLHKISPLPRLNDYVMHFGELPEADAKPPQSVEDMKDTMSAALRLWSKGK
jgi:hypothetical protein